MYIVLHLLMVVILVRECQEEAILCQGEDHLCQEVAIPGALRHQWGITNAVLFKALAQAIPEVPLLTRGILVLPPIQVILVPVQLPGIRGWVRLLLLPRGATLLHQVPLQL